MVLSWPIWPDLSWTCSRMLLRAKEGMTKWCSISGESLSLTDRTRYNRPFLTVSRYLSFTSVCSSWLLPGPLGQGVPFLRHWVTWAMHESFACSCCQSMAWSKGEVSHSSGRTVSSKAYESTMDELLVTCWHIPSPLSLKPLPEAFGANWYETGHLHLGWML